MTAIDYFAWLVLIVIVVSVVVAFILLAQLPGKIAVKNRHPQVAAIKVASWLGLLMTFGIVWLLAMVWASMTPADTEQADGMQDSGDNLQQRIKSLEEKINVLQEQLS